LPLADLRQEVSLSPANTQANTDDFFQAACRLERDKLKFVGHLARVPLTNKSFYLPTLHLSSVHLPFTKLPITAMFNKVHLSWDLRGNSLT
jgi:hypothetical protein